MAQENVASTTKALSRTLLAPQVIEHRGLDFGLAALRSILLGCGLKADEHALNQVAPSEDTDSLERLSHIAAQFGLDTERILLPTDYLFVPQALPIIVALQPFAEEMPHLGVIWNRVGPFFQVMDPRLGRRWLNTSDLLAEINGKRPSMADVPLTLAAWRAETERNTFRAFLRTRLTALRLPPATIDAWLETAYLAPHGYGVATLDAAVRLVTNTVQNGGVSRGAEAEHLLSHCLAQTMPAVQQGTMPQQTGLLSPTHWAIKLNGPLPEAAAASKTAAKVEAQSNLPAADEQDDALNDTPQSPRGTAEASVLFQGVAVLRILARRPSQASPSKFASATPEVEPKAETPEAVRAPDDAPPPEEVTAPAQAQTTEATLTPSLLAYLRDEGNITLGVIISAMAMTGAGIFLQAILFRGLATLSLRLVSFQQRLWAIGLIIAFAVTLLCLKWFSHSAFLKLGERLDGRLRMAVLALIPNLSSQYFQQFSAGDIIERIHSLRAVRDMPYLSGEFIHLLCQFLLTMVALIWLDWVTALLACLKLVLPVLLMRGLGVLNAEIRLVRTYLGYLSRFYLDAMRALMAIRTHGAERTTRREYEGLLVKWARGNLRRFEIQQGFLAVSSTLSQFLTIVIIMAYVLRGGDPTNLLLIAYWAITLETSRGGLLFLFFTLINNQGKVVRFLQLFDAPLEKDLMAAQTTSERPPASGTPQASPPPPTIEAEATRPKGVKIVFQQTSVQIGNQMILRGIDLTIPAGSQVAIVGPSGAGKSTLMGLLMGWHYPATGQIFIDGEALGYECLQKLRRETAWVDPSIQLWNRSFFYNLRYSGNRAPLNRVIDQADLREVLERLPEGMQTRLGGEGSLVSGGEGQRVRFGRAMQRWDARLVILDEPFRGLDREKRRTLLANAREYWKEATLITVTHDVEQTQAFARVLVVENGRIIEDGTPQALLQKTSSRYRALLEAEEAVREKLWSSTDWRRLWLEDGHLREQSQET